MRHIFFLLFLVASLSQAQAEESAYNRVDFRVEAGRDVANDLLSAVMSVEVQESQPARVAQRINTVLNGALKKAAAFAAIKASSGNQNTYPVYGKNNQVDAWRGHGEIRLESRDFKAAGELIMQLQQDMQLRNVQFSIAPETRAKIENELITEAIAAFRARADAIRSAMGAQAYKNVNLSINNSGGMPSPVPRTMRAVALESSIPAPDFSAGDSRMAVQVSGMIELQ